MLTGGLSLVAALLAAHCGVPARAADSPASPAEQRAAVFRDLVAPLLAAKCGGCHGPAGAESGFRIDDRGHALAGGDSGTKGIVPGDPGSSEVFKRIATADAETRMPADGEPLSAAEQAIEDAQTKEAREAATKAKHQLKRELLLKADPSIQPVLDKLTTPPGKPAA